MFGNPITDGTQVAVGTVGYVASFDLSLKLINKATAVQLQLSATNVMSAVLKTANTIPDLFDYLEDTACPDFAWGQNGNKIFVFIKTATYPYVVTTRIAFFLFRNNQDAPLITDTQDFPGKAENYICSRALQMMYIDKALRVPMNIQNEVTREKAALGI